MKLRVSSSGCKTRPAKGEPACAGRKPGDDPSNVVGDAEACARVGHGACGPATSRLPGGRGSCCPCRPSPPCRRLFWARREGSPAGCATMARTQRTVPYPGRPSPLLDPSRRDGEPVTRLRRTARCGRPCRRPLGAENNAPASRQAMSPRWQGQGGGGRQRRGAVGARRGRPTRPSTGRPC